MIAYLNGTPIEFRDMPEFMAYLARIPAELSFTVNGETFRGGAERLPSAYFSVELVSEHRLVASKTFQSSQDATTYFNREDVRAWAHRMAADLGRGCTLRLRLWKRTLATYDTFGYKDGLWHEY